MINGKLMVNYIYCWMILMDVIFGSELEVNGCENEKYLIFLIPRFYPR